MNEMSERNNIVLSHPDELMEFLWIKPKISGINVDIFVDDSKSYQRNNRPLLLFARNGYDKSVDESLSHSLSPNIRLFLMMKWNLIYHMMIYFLFRILYRLIVN